MKTLQFELRCVQYHAGSVVSTIISLFCRDQNTHQLPQGCAASDNSTFKSVPPPLPAATENWKYSERIKKCMKSYILILCELNHRNSDVTVYCNSTNVTSNVVTVGRSKSIECYKLIKKMRKTSKISHQIFKEKRIFKFVPSPIPTTGNTSAKFYKGAQLHLHSFRYTKA